MEAGDVAEGEGDEFSVKRTAGAGSRRWKQEEEDEGAEEEEGEGRRHSAGAVAVVDLGETQASVRKQRKRVGFVK